MHRLAAIILLLAPLALAEPDRSPIEPKALPLPEEKVEPIQPAITKLDDGRLQIGQVTFDPKTREIRVPAMVNQAQGLLEYILVDEIKGKIHESLLSTRISATHLNLAFKLLHYKASRELYYKVNEDGTVSGDFQEATDEEKRKSRVQLLLQWTQDGKTKKRPIGDWMRHTTTGKTMPDSVWVYGGSFVHDGKFAAESSGNMIAVFLCNVSMVNFAGETNQFDDVWESHTSRMPAYGEKVTLIIKPFKEPTDP